MRTGSCRARFLFCMVEFQVMKVVILYRPKSEHGTVTETFVHDLARRYDASKLQVLDADSVAGVDMAALYEIMTYPAILALRDDGSILKDWEGDTLPLMDEVAYYLATEG